MGGFCVFQLLAYVIRLIERQILLRNEYLAAEICRGFGTARNG